MKELNDGGVYYAPTRTGPEWRMDWQEHITYILWIYHDAGQITVKENKRCLWPRRCYLTGKQLWFKKATKLVRDYGGPRLDTMWFDPNAYTMFLLQGRRDYI